MNNFTCRLPGITKIGWIDCRILPSHVALRYICRNEIVIMADINSIVEFDSASCECTTNIKNNGSFAEASLNFKSPTLLEQREYLAFIVKSPSGECFLIGSKEQPFIQLSISQSLGSEDGDSATYNYEISHVGIRSLIPCFCNF